VLSIFGHALSHRAVGQLAQKTSKVLIEFLEATDVAAFLK
jgi:hypothetical protein